MARVVALDSLLSRSTLADGNGIARLDVSSQLAGGAGSGFNHGADGGESAFPFGMLPYLVSKGEVERRSQFSSVTNRHLLVPWREGPVFRQSGSSRTACRHDTRNLMELVKSVKRPETFQAAFQIILKPDYKRASPT